MSAQRISSFDLQPGQVVADKYRVLEKLGKGWEGEIYLLRESSTRVERAGKFFFPHRNPRDQTAGRYARKLHKLRDCPMIIPYHTRERLEIDEMPVTLLVSEYVSGDTLSSFLRRQPMARLSVFPALHLLHSLACGIETIHRHREYHGDLHAHNIMVKRFGLTFELRLLDLFNRGPFSARRVQDDICDMVRIFYDALGGPKHYARLPAPAKEICRGLKRSLILERFRTASQLARFIEHLSL
jgi:serine/threonine protein kinase